MTDEEWAGIDDLLRNWWSQEWDAGRSQAYRLAVSRFSAEEVAGALGRLLDRGLTFRPSASELRAELAGGGAPPPPAWAALLQELGTHKAFRQLPRPEYSDAKNVELAQKVADALHEIHPLAAALVADIGLDTFRRAPLDPRYPPAPGDEGIDGRVTLSRLKDAYDRRVQRWEDGDRKVLEPGQLAVRLLGENDGTMADLVERLRPARQLEAVGDPDGEG